MVQLVLFKDGYNYNLTVEFQFHYGSISSFINYNYSKYEYLFQFHYGSISSETLSKKESVEIGFQFHYGSISSEKQTEV